MPFEHGGTKTDYPKTVTKTKEVDCKGCKLEVANDLGVGPAVFFSATVRAYADKDVMAYVCKPTPTPSTRY